MESVAQCEYLLALALYQLRYRNAGPAGNDTRDLVLGYFVAEQGIALSLLCKLFFLGKLGLELRQGAVLQLRRLVQVVFALCLFDLAVGGFYLLAEILHLADGVLLVLPLCLHRVELLALLGKLLLDIREMLLRELVSLLFQSRFLDLVLHDGTAYFIKLLRHAVHFGAYHRACLVHEVYRLIRQEPVGDVPVGERSRRDKRVVVDLYAVEYLVALLQTSQYGYGILYGRLVRHNGLETTLKRGVLLDILAVFVEGGRAYAVEFAARQHRFQKVAGVHCAVALAGADDEVDLINEQQDTAFALLDLVEHRLQTLLKLALVLCTGDERAHIQREQLAVLQVRGNVAAHDTQSQTLDYSGLADAGFADEAGVILGLTGKNTDSASYLVISADNRVELVLARKLNEILTVLVQHVVGLLRLLGGHSRGAAYLGYRLEQLILGHAEAAEYSGNSAGGLLRERKEQVLHADVLVLHAIRLGLRLGERLVEVGGNVDLACLPAAAGNPRHALDEVESRLLYRVGVDVHFSQDLRSKTAVLGKKRVQEMLLLNAVVLVAYRDVLCGLYRFEGFFRVLVRIHTNASFAC